MKFKTINRITNVNIELIILLVFTNIVNIYSQTVVPDNNPCCFPHYEWHFDEMWPLCDNAIPWCGEKELSSSLCDQCETISSEEPVCCNYFSTHGTPSLENRSGRIIGKVWFEGDLSEGLKLCANNVEVGCYNLKFSVIKTTHGAYDNDLEVYVVNNNYLPENWLDEEDECFEVPPSVPSNAIKNIINVDLSTFGTQNTIYYAVSVNFKTNPDLVDPDLGFSIWFHPGISENSSILGIGIDDIYLSNIKSICADDLIINEDDVPIDHGYEAFNSISISGSPIINVSNAGFYAGKKITISPSAKFDPEVNTKSILFTIVDCDNDCPEDVSISQEIPPDPYINSQPNHEITETNDTPNHESIDNTLNIVDKEIQDLFVYVVDPYQGVIEIFETTNKNLNKEILLKIEKHPKNRVYSVFLLSNNRLNYYSTFLNF